VQGSPAGKEKAMHEWKSQNHVKWDGKYHGVFIPKYRRKVLYGKLRAKVGTILRELCQQKGVELIEGKAMTDDIQLCLSISAKYSVAHVVGFLKGKSAIRIHRELLGEKRMVGLHFWAKGYGVSTIGYDEEAVRRTIRDQDEHDSNQLSLDID
jgi:putative transposase